MNRSLLDQLQQMRSFPSITILMNTTPSAMLNDDEQASARRLIDAASQRLSKLDGVDPGVFVARMNELLATCSDERAGHALAMCVSSDHSVVVTLGSAVDERVVIDETFATRDLVADLHRTAVYGVLTVSDAQVRAFLGDSQRLVEQRSGQWPLQRPDDTSNTIWLQQVDAAVRALHLENPIPVVTAGVDRSTSRWIDAEAFDVVGHIGGNHDRTAASELHTLVWPVVLDWKALRQDRALKQLDQARSAKRYASGVDEIWPLASEGRVDLLVVEDDYALSARIDNNGHLHPTEDRDRDVVDDVVDEIIEAVIQNGGHTTFVGPSTLDQHGSMAAVLRF
jgi:hypothetical protein